MTMAVVVVVIVMVMEVVVVAAKELTSSISLRGLTISAEPSREDGVF